MDVPPYRTLLFGLGLVCGLLSPALAGAQSTTPADPPPVAEASPTPGASSIAPDEGPGAAAPPADEGAQVPEVDATSEEVTPGHVHLVVFAGDVPASHATVRLADGSQISTDSAGAAAIELPPGKHELSVVFPEGGSPRALADILVVRDQTTEVIATLNKDGSVTLDVQPPVGAALARTPETVEAPETGTLDGVVRGEEDGEPIVGAGVYVAGQQVEAATDTEGRFTMVLPVGVHTLSIIHTKFSTQTVNDVEIKVNETTSLKVTLTPAAIELQEFVVSAPYISGGVAGLLNQRRESAALSDSIGAEDISRMPANNAAQAAQRVVGATIVGGRFVYVRGLGERYSNALLNGAPLPSPEPDRATVPLDLFPSQILASLDISKTFTPDVPGNFAGGSVRIKTKEVPEGFLFGGTMSIGANTRGTGKKYYGQSHTGKLDLLGFDDGGRALPSEVPKTYTLNRLDPKPDGTSVELEELSKQGQTLNSTMALKRRTLWPNFNGTLALGNSWHLGPDTNVGVLTSLIYRRNLGVRRETLNEFRADVDSDTGLIAWNAFKGEAANDAVRWGAFASAALHHTKKHKLSLVLMHSQLADTNTRLLEGRREYIRANVNVVRQEYISRGLTNGQLQGEHVFDMFNGAQLNWLLSMARAARDEDDSRDFVWVRFPGADDWRFYNSVRSGTHFFADQSETARVGGLDWLQPIVTGDSELKVKLGTLISLKDRDFESRGFAITPEDAPLDVLSCGGQFDPIVCPRNLFTDEHIAADQLRLQEFTRDEDAYRAKLNVFAGYIMGELAIGKRWRFIGGARLEHTLQEILLYDQFQDKLLDDTSKNALLEQTNVLPSGSIVFSPAEKGAIRLAVSQTIARPQLRELAPFAYTAYFGSPLESGNPDLKLTRILNGDLRFEYFPSPQEVAAVSVFAKSFADPIEPVLVPSSDTSILTYRNALSARLLGVEFELRKNLGFFAKFLENFGVIASLMLATSEIDVEQTGNEFLTNTHRPLVQAAPYVLNAAIDYENSHGTQARILYNVSGKRLVQVGTEQLDDAYLQPQHVVDLTASQALGDHLRLRLNVWNLLDSPYLITQGPDPKSYNTTYRYKDGVRVSVGLAYDH